MSPDRFAGKIASLIRAAGPYEETPVVCVAVSGGSDSMALALSVDAWARTVGGRVIGLTVDHRLRAGSTDEADRVNRWLGHHQIEHHTLTWVDPDGSRALQNTARIARYGLLEGWCRDHHILHLFLGHTADDQAETFLMRRDKGSGPDGLSAMSMITERQHYRLLRPLLSVRRTALQTYLAQRQQSWLDDPSNHNEEFERIRWRRMLALEQQAPDSYCNQAMTFGQDRRTRDGAVADLAGRCVSIDPAGFIRIDRRHVRSAPTELARRLVGRALMVVGGDIYPPRQVKLSDLLAIVRGPYETTRTLSRCRIECRETEILVMRELRFLPYPQTVRPGMALSWDNRFALRLKPDPFVFPPTMRLQPLGADGDRQVCSGMSENVFVDRLPRNIRLALPALVDENRVLCVPHLDFCLPDGKGSSVGWQTYFDNVVFQSLNSLSGTGYFVANLEKQAIS